MISALCPIWVRLNACQIERFRHNMNKKKMKAHRALFLMLVVLCTAARLRLVLSRSSSDTVTRQVQFLMPDFCGFVYTAIDSTNPDLRAHTHSPLALIAKDAEYTARARELLNKSPAALPDFIEPRFGLSGDANDPSMSSSTILSSSK